MAKDRFHRVERTVKRPSVNTQRGGTMILTIQLDGYHTDIEFTWESLRAPSCWLWSLGRAGITGKDRPVI